MGTYLLKTNEGNEWQKKIRRKSFYPVFLSFDRFSNLKFVLRNTGIRIGDVFIKKKMRKTKFLPKWHKKYNANKRTVKLYFNRDMLIGCVVTQKDGKTRSKDSHCCCTF